MQQIARRKPNNSAAFMELGDLLLRKSDTDGARAAFRRAKVVLGHDDFDAHFNLGSHLRDQHLFDDALATFRNCEDLATKMQRADLKERAAQAVRETELLPLLTAARAHAAHREWAQSARCYAQLFSRNKLQGSDVWFEHAAVMLLSGDREGYRNACTRMIEHSTEKWFRAYLTARATTLTPDYSVEAARLGLVELKSFTSPAPWSMTIEAAMIFRSGQFDRALALLDQSLKADTKPGTAVLTRLWMALTYQKLGKVAQARSALDTATKWLDQFEDGLPPRAEQDLKLHLHNWLEAHILRREAEAMLNKQ
jgi:tetratricopeptide (TPR) repeat protein